MLKKRTLIGLKENFIIGKLIPTGTGLKRYQDIKINTKLEEKNEEASATSETDSVN